MIQKAEVEMCLILSIVYAILAGAGLYCLQKESKNMESGEIATLAMLICFLCFWAGALIARWLI